MTLLVSDSIPKYVAGIDYLELHCFPGTTLGRLVAVFERNSALKHAVTYAEFVIVHVGTNDISILSPDSFPAAVNSLFTAIRQINPAIKLLYSAILPRPVDWSSTQSLVKRANNLIMRFCKARKIPFLSTFRPFVGANGVIHRHMFAVRDGGLHLNLEGSRVLTNFYLQVVKRLRKA